MRKNGINRGGLYGFFVKGEALQGTLDDVIDANPPNVAPPVAVAMEKQQSKKRKREESSVPAEDKAARKERRKLRKSEEQHVEVLPENNGFAGEPELQLKTGTQTVLNGSNGHKRQNLEARQQKAAADAIYFATGVYPMPGTYDVAKVVLPKFRTQQSSLDSLAGTITVDDARPSVTATASPTTTTETALAWHKLSHKKRTQYTKRAASKGQDPEDYYASRVAKKSKLAMSGSVSAMDSVLSAKSTQEPPNAPFVIDLVGDHNLFPATVCEATYHRWHPDMLGDREAKDLSIDERRARKAFEHARRRVQRIASGRDPLTPKERRKEKMEKTRRKTNQLTKQALKKEGFGANETVSKHALKDARKAARRELKERKKLKRNKVIHRK